MLAWSLFAHFVIISQVLTFPRSLSTGLDWSAHGESPSILRASVNCGVLGLGAHHTIAKMCAVRSHGSSFSLLRWLKHKSRRDSNETFSQCKCVCVCMRVLLCMLTSTRSCSCRHERAQHSTQSKATTTTDARCRCDPLKQKARSKNRSGSVQRPIQSRLAGTKRHEIP